MEFKIEITDAMINDAVKASVEVINSDRCNIDESVTEVIKNHIEDGDWLSDDKISKIINKKIISSFAKS